jgi:hypothetical protein
MIFSTARRRTKIHLKTDMKMKAKAKDKEKKKIRSVRGEFHSPSASL